MPLPRVRGTTKCGIRGPPSDTRPCVLNQGFVVSSGVSHLISRGVLMSHDELLALLHQARVVLDHYLVDERETMRDDVAQICMAIDDALPSEGRVELKRAPLEPATRRSAA
jgi:hypothetical protein